MKLLIIFTLLLTQTISADNWKQELTDWKTQRITNLTKPNGWLSLIGMQWLHNGQNSIGSAADSDIKLPHGPAHIGTFNLDKDKITFTVAKDVAISIDDKLVAGNVAVAMDSSGEPTIFKIDTFEFYVIKRGEPALRIKDSNAKTLINFRGLDYFPVTEKFRVSAKFVPYNPAKEIEIINVLGLLSKEISPGQLHFNLNDKNYKLDVMDAEDEFYLIFADKTSGRTTYGPGRFLYIPKPKQGNTTIIDFNKAYNPPCAFTDYSTCPLPPPQNRIPVYIQAGEKLYQR